MSLVSVLDCGTLFFPIEEQLYYTGRVWCPEVAPHHTVIARRNGKVFISYQSNEQEWSEFRANKTNEAFIDRIYLVRVPYCLRLEEEVKIYQKLLRESDLHDAP